MCVFTGIYNNLFQYGMKIDCNLLNCVYMDDDLLKLCIFIFKVFYLEVDGVSFYYEYYYIRE